MSWQPPAGGQLPEGWTPIAPDKQPTRVLGIRASIWALILAIVIGGAVIAGTSSNNDGPSVDDQGYGAHAACAEFTRNYLKAPAGADFPEYNDPGVSISHDGTKWTVQSFVDAENSFGANIRTGFLCVVEDQGDTWNLDRWTEL